MRESHPAHQLVLHVGCQRSGTTLLHLILDSHRQIESFDENMIGLLRQYVANPAVPISHRPVVSFKLPEASNPWEPDCPLLFEAPGPPKFLLLTRHVLDVATSMCQLDLVLPNPLVDGRAVVKWIEHAAGRYAALKLSTHGLPPQYLADPAVFAATLWAEHNRFWSAKLNQVGGHHVRYEDLIDHPRATLERLLAFLGCDWDEAVLHHEAVRHAPGTGTVYGRTDARRPIDCQSVGRWRSFLNPDQRQRILDLCQDVLQALGYHISRPQGL